MARKLIDPAKNAVVNAGAINDNFEELYEESGGPQHTEPVDGYLLDNPFGGNVDCNNFGLGDMLSMVNSVLIQRELHDSMLKLQPTYDDNGVVKPSYTHGPNLAVYDGKAYVTAFYNPKGDDNIEYPIGDMRIALFIFDIATWQVEKVVDNGVQQDFYCVARHGDKVGDKYIASGVGEPLIYINNGVVTIVFTCRISDSPNDAAPNGDWVWCYRDYNIANKEWGANLLCKLKADSSSSPVDMTATALGNVLGISGLTAFNAFSQYAEHQPSYVNGSGQTVTLDKEYYINIANDTKIPHGAIMRTKDFHTFTYWITPQWPVDVTIKFEMAMTTVDTAWGKKLRVAARTKNERELFIGTIDFDTYNTDGSVKEVGHVHTTNANMYRFIPDGGSRPCWFRTTLNGVRQYCYLMHMPDIGSRSRRWAAIECVNGNTLVAASVSRVATTTQMIYPSVATTIIGGKTKYIVAFMYNCRVYIAHFSLPRTFNELIPIAAKIIDTFGPSES